MAGKLKVVALISGRGSNLQALIDASRKPSFPARIVAVISNKADAKGLLRAKKAKIPTHVLSHKDYATREDYDKALDALIRKAGGNFICLAGFMRLLTGSFVRKWEGRIINIHPSLLPSFKGAHAHEDAIAAGVKISGCTVHFVVPEMDSGPIILQAAVPVMEGDDAEALAARVLKAEHQLYPAALKLIAEGKVALKEGKTRISAKKKAGAVLISPGF
jgi:formyltetrahydrofolate-dependent phosphoribosylglycinamide formyltransferase